MLWVLNVGESVEGEGAGLVGSGESGRADWRQGGDGLLRPSLRRLERQFSAARHTYCTHAEARMVFVKRTVWLGAIKDIDMVPLFLLDLGGG